jgi:hypothetical protein
VLCAPLLFRRTGLVKGVILTQLATAAALASLALFHPGPHGGTPALWVYPIYMAMQFMNEPGIYSLLMDQIPPGERSSASASTFFVSNACQAMASVAMGAAIVRFGYSAALLGIAGLAVAATLLFARLSGSRAASAPDSPGYLEDLTAIQL